MTPKITDAALTITVIADYIYEIIRACIAHILLNKTYLIVLLKNSIHSHRCLFKYKICAALPTKELLRDTCQG